MDEATRQDVVSGLERKGIRLLPHPFDSAVSIVSDIDVSCRATIQGYVGFLVRRLGLDFGDSIWLAGDVEDGEWAFAGQGLLNADFSADAAYHDEAGVPLQTLAETVSQYHIGNVDHFHAFLQAGPRVLLLTPESRDGTVVTATLAVTGPARIDRMERLYALGVSVAGDFAGDVASPRITIAARDGREDSRFEEADRYTVGDRRHIDQVRLTPVATRPEAIELADIASVRVTFASCEAADALHHILIVTAPRALLLDRIDWLRRQHGVTMTVITEHAGRHFRTRRRTEIFDAALTEAIRTSGGLGPHNGRHVDTEDAVVFSTDADDPESVSRVLPELATDHDLRFIVPAAATNDIGWPVLDLVTPTATRAGCELYWGRRTLPNIRPPEGRKRFDGTRSRQSTFTQRVGKVLEGVATNPGLCWPIYTHLGRLDTGQTDIPAPYFAEEHLLQLQAQVFGRGCAPDHRIWFTRASTLYDYALVIRSIGDHVERPDADTIRITSWHDQVLDKRMPRCPAQLYGVTFAVDDPGNASITLDGKPIDTFYRNEPGKAGSASITIAESGLRWPVVGTIDPVRAIRDTQAVGEWNWDEAALAGRLLVGDGGLGSLRLTLGGRQPEGAQALSIDVCRGVGISLGITVETVAGARFFFGEPSVATTLGMDLGMDFVASAAIHPHWWRGDSFRRFTFAFHDLVWRTGTRPENAMPNDALSAVTLWSVGRAGQSAMFRDVTFLRPHTRATDGNFCLAGTAAGTPGSLIEAVPLSDNGERKVTVVDAHRYFCFGVLPPGAYRIRNLDGDSTWVDTTRDVIDLSSHVVDLRLAHARGNPSISGSDGAKI